MECQNIYLEVNLERPTKNPSMWPNGVVVLEEGELCLLFGILGYFWWKKLLISLLLKW